MDTMLTRLKLTGIREELESPLDEAARKDLTLREALGYLLQAEVARKDQRRFAMGLSIALAQGCGDRFGVLDDQRRLHVGLSYLFLISHVELGRVHLGFGEAQCGPASREVPRCQGRNAAVHHDHLRSRSGPGTRVKRHDYGTTPAPRSWDHPDPGVARRAPRSRDHPARHDQGTTPAGVRSPPRSAVRPSPALHRARVGGQVKGLERERTGTQRLRLLMSVFAVVRRSMTMRPATRAP